jgi:FkbM family methyltransferase
MQLISETGRNLFYIQRSKASKKQKREMFFSLMRLSFKKKFAKKNKSVVFSHFAGFKISAFDYSSLYFLYKEIFCADDYYFSVNAKKPVIIDCGANIGAATIYFKKLFPEAQIHCFEANPFTYDLLLKNIADNKTANIFPHNVALFDEEKDLSFFISKDHGTLVGSVFAQRGGNEEITVKAEKLSAYIKKIEKIDLIKIDVEGAEWNIINDLEKEKLLSKPDQYIIEYHHNMNKSKSEFSLFLNKFETAGFSYSIKTTYNNLKSFQDILIHFYKNEN